MRYLRKVQCFFISLSFILALVPFRIHAANSFDIVGWREESYHKAVTSVKVNGVELSKYNPSMYSSRPESSRVTAEASGSVSVEITLEDGYALSSSGPKMYLSGVQSETNHITSSASSTSIQLPSAAYEDDQELYLSFKTERVLEGSTPQSINSVTLDVNGIMTCGTKINDATDPSPDISVPSDGGYIIAPGSAWWLKKEGVNYVENEYPLNAKKSIIFKVDLLDRGPYIFNENLDRDAITVNNGELLDFEMDTFGGPEPESIANRLCLTIGMDLEHVPGRPKKEDVVSPTCTKPGHHDDVVRCEECDEELSRVRSIVDAATGHKWGEWEVVKEPTVYEEGTEQRKCKNDSSHVQTRTIPRLDSRVVTFNNQGHGKTPDPQRIAVGEIATEPGNMFATGYVFGGWYIDSACTIPFDFQTPITEDITLYAKWLPDTYGSIVTGDKSGALIWSAVLGLSLSMVAFVTLKKNRKIFGKTK